MVTKLFHLINQVVIVSYLTTYYLTTYYLTTYYLTT